MSILDAILASHSMLNLTTTKAKRAIKNLMLELIDETDSELGVPRYERLREKVKAL